VEVRRFVVAHTGGSMFRFQAVVLLLASFLLIGCGGVTSSTPPPSISPSQPPAQQPPATPSGIPANAKVISDIQKLTNWSSCSGDCSGEAGTNATYSMTPGISSPSLTGSAVRFDITDATSWGTALWWKQVGGDDTKTHFVYELSFYLTDVGAGQALEFNVNQNAGGWRYEYATQCDYRGTGTWRVWDPSRLGWNTTGKQCPDPAPNQWHKLAWEVERNSTDHTVRFIAVTLDGNRNDIGATTIAVPASGSGIDVAFQMDCIGVVRPWSVWVDAIKLSEW
jgi:hypothetical protein